MNTYNFCIVCSYIELYFLFYKGLSTFASGDGKQLAHPEVLRRLTSSVTCALDEAAAALTKMRSDNNTKQANKRFVIFIYFIIV